jgi:hypothetical protein
MILKHKKFWASLFLAIALVVPIRRSEAFLPIIILAGWLLSIGGDAILITDIIAGTTGLISGAVWYDCNKFAASPVCTKSASGASPSGMPPGSITVSLRPDASRSNPDPTKFNDPVPPARDVTPKGTIASNSGPKPSPPVPSSQSSPVDAGVVNLPLGDDGTNWMLQQSHNNGDQVTMAVLTLSSQYWSTPRYMPVIFQSTVCNVAATDPQRTADLNACGDIYLPRYNALVAPYPAQDKLRIPCMTNDSTVWCVVMAVEFPMVNAPLPTCDNGYSMTNGSCNLTNPSAVVKPSTTPCEILINPATNAMLNDGANPNCAGDITVAGGSTNVTSGDGSSMSVVANSQGGFDVTKTGADGSSVSASTGPYDAVGQGYPIQSTSTHSKGDNNGADCGVVGLAPCGISMSLDAATAQASSDAQGGISSGITSLKGSLSGIDDNKFAWSFIPSIPTAECSEPSIRNPLNDSTITMPICGAFNSVSFFINGVLAFVTVLGCVHQVRKAMAA